MVKLPDNMQVTTAQKRTRGERFFDFFTYQIVNFGVTELLSLAIVDLFLGGTDRKDGKATSYFANKFGFKKTSDKLYNLQEKLNASPVGETGGAVFTLNLGGHLTAVLVKQLENNRVGLSRRFDNIIDWFTGTKKNAQEIEQRDARYEILRNTPTKSGWKIFGGRVSGMLASMALNQIPEAIDKGMGNEPTHGRYGFRRLTGMGGNYLEKKLVIPMMEARKGGDISDMATKRAAYWSELALFETWCTALTSIVMEKTVKWGDKKKQPNDTPPIASKPATSENKNSKALTSRFYDDEEGEEKKERWADKGYDYEDEVGIQM